MCDFTDGISTTWSGNIRNVAYLLRVKRTPVRAALLLGAEASDLATVKDFLRFYIATSQPKLSDKPTVDSVNTVAEWIFNWVHTSDRE